MARKIIDLGAKRLAPAKSVHSAPEVLKSNPEFVDAELATTVETPKSKKHAKGGEHG